MRVRPFAREFLRHCSKSWNLVVFTASTKDYADIVLERLDPDSLYIKNVLSREHCLLFGFKFIKDFRIIAQPEVRQANLLMLDNKLISFGLNLHNGIPILPFLGDESDSELKAIIPTLDLLSDASADIAQFIRSRYNYEQLLKANLI